MKKWLVSALLLLQAGVAWALPQKFGYLDAVNGSNANNGRSAATAIQKFATDGNGNGANRRTRNGEQFATNTVADSDVVWIMAAGTYDSLPNPQRPATGGARFIYQSAVNLDTVWIAPNALPVIPAVTGAYLNGRSVVWRGLKLAGGLSVGPADITKTGVQRDSVNDCYIDGNLYFNQSYYCTVARSFVAGTKFGSSIGEGLWPHGNMVQDCSMPNLTNTQDGATSCFSGTSSCQGILLRAWTDSLNIYRTRFAIYGQHDIGANSPIKMFKTYRLIMKNCRVDITQDSECIGPSSDKGEPFFWIGIRDSSQLFTWAADSFFINGKAATDGYFSQDGSYPGSTHAMHFDSLYISNSNGTCITFKDGMRDYSFTNSVFISGNAQAIVNRSAQLLCPITLDHNTIIGQPALLWCNVANGACSCLNPLACALADSHRVNNDAIGGLSIYGTVTATGATDSCKITNNIIGTWDPGGPLRADDPATPVAGYYGTPNGNIGINNNMYWEKLYHTTPGDCSIGYYSYSHSKPGNGQAFNTTFSPNERDGFTGYPAFGHGYDTTFVRFTPEIGELSMARGKGTVGTDVGARTYTDAEAAMSSDVIRITTDAGVTERDTIRIYNTGTVGSVTVNTVKVSDARYVSATLSSNVIAPGVASYITLAIATTPGTESAEWTVSLRTSDARNQTLTVYLLYGGWRPPAGSAPGGTDLPPVLRRPH